MNKKLKIIYGLVILFVLLLVMIIFYLFINKSREIKMIDLNNKSVEEIKDYAVNNNLDLYIDEVYNDSVVKGALIKQSIKVGEVISANQKLVVTISLGKMDKDVYVKYKVDESGNVPIMMYHGIHNVKSEDTGYIGGNVDKQGYQRTGEAFRNDLTFYYQNNYRMIRLDDYVKGIIDVSIGKSPIVLTFDDGLKNNINVTGLDESGNIIIDPNCAVGILEEFKNQYPDFNVTATFFLNNELFQQPQYNEKIVKWLVDNGYDVGNHSYGHTNFVDITAEQAQMEIGRMYLRLDQIIPDKYVKIVALPFGSPYDKEHKNFAYILNGVYNDFKYDTSATLRVGWESDYSPFSKNFDNKFLKRIRAYDNNGLEFDIDMSFKNLEKNRYISDGDKNKVVIRSENSKYLNESITLEVITY